MIIYFNRSYNNKNKNKVEREGLYALQCDAINDIINKSIDAIRENQVESVGEYTLFSEPTITKRLIAPSCTR